MKLAVNYFYSLTLVVVEIVSAQATTKNDFVPELLSFRGFTLYLVSLMKTVDRANSTFMRTYAKTYRKIFPVMVAKCPIFY